MVRLVDSLRMLFEEGRFGGLFFRSWKGRRDDDYLKRGFYVMVLMRKVVHFSFPSVVYLFDLRIRIEDYNLVIIIFIIILAQVK